MPQKPFKPTDQQRRMVQAMSSFGIPQTEIAAVVQIDRSTLAKHFRMELDTATAQANARVAEMLYKRAVEGDTRAAMFWLERRGGDEWRNKPVVQLVPGDFTIDLNPVTEDIPMLSDPDDHNRS